MKPVYHPERVEALKSLQADVEREARESGIGERYVGMNQQDRLKLMVLGVVDDLVEAYGAAQENDPDKWMDAMAETLLTILRAAGLAGFDLSDLIEQKRLRQVEARRFTVGGGISGRLG